MSDWTTDAADAIDKRRRDSCANARSSRRRRSPAVVVYGLLAALLVASRRRAARRSASFRGARRSIDQGDVWAAWLTLGGIFVLAGAFCWTKRNP